ncbi:MAG: thioesterase [Cereibacter sphaeroides]|uniref:Thioesterase n=1 Tax=Cereibacter sphaeroides TaxID=1063 RepID=A0A2W5TVL0_CERSP|nr:MAG: thioesterase [Cereibacter sphaeroides]
MAYTRTIQIEFNHCDPAGIVFYPRYFEMVNSVTENFFADEVGRSYAEMMKAVSGVPTARLEANFRAPSRLGDKLEFTLEVVRLGASSVTFLIVGRGNGELRLSVEVTLVWVEGSLSATPWPEDMRARLAAHQKEI